MELQKLVTAAELASVLRVSVATVYARVKQRLVPHYKIGDRLLFNLAEVLESCRQPAETGDFEIPKIATSSARR